MKRLRRITHDPGQRTAYKICPECKKMKVEEVGLTAGDGQRWYCCERCLNAGERMYRGRRP